VVVTRREVVEAFTSKLLREAHPHVRAGRATERQVERELLANFGSADNVSHLGAGHGTGSWAGAEVSEMEWGGYWPN
jgi:hypothetical protein